MSTKVDEKEEKRISKTIEREIQRAQQELSKNPPAVLLLLGPGDSGKTTLLKQMKILHGAGFTDAERLDNLKKIRQNILENMDALLKGAQSLGLSIKESPENIAKFQAVDRLDPEFTPDVALIVKRLWNEDSIKAAFARGNEFFVQDTANYFLDTVETFANEKYVPSNQDILMTRFSTTKISETIFQIKEARYSLIDVGGQTKYRAAWPRFFDNADSILFIVSLACYDQYMEEEGHRTKSRMVDSLELFDQICNQPLLANIAIILLMNKTDLAEKKVLKSSVKKFFPEFEGDPHNFDLVKHFFQKKFKSLNKNNEKTIYTHFTTNTDTKLMDNIIGSIIDIVAKMSLKACGLD